MGNVLVTGASGFLGQHIVNSLQDGSHHVYTLNRLSRRPPIFGDSRPVINWLHDFRAPLPSRLLNTPIDYIIHCGAEVHGLRSLQNPQLFVESNVMGTLNLLEAARIWQPKQFVYISSAEAVGSASTGYLRPDAAMHPSNPYAAAKAAAEMLVRSYTESFGLQTVTIRTMNIFGEGQDTSKFLPATIKKVLNGESLVCHVGPDGIAGSRQWCYVKLLVHAILLYTFLEIIPMLDPVTPTFMGGVRHIVGPELSNLDIINLVQTVLGRNVPVRLAQPGASHDMRYALGGGNYISKEETVEMMAQTIRWYEGNPQWLKEY